MRSTYTYALLEVSHAAYAEIKAKLQAAGYSDQFHDARDGDGVVIDMHGLALKDEGTLKAAEPVQHIQEVFANKFGTTKAVCCSCGFATTYTMTSNDADRLGMEHFQRMHDAH